MINKMNFENYNDYLLSLNIAQISREFGFKKIGMNSLYLITHLMRAYIEKIATCTKESTESSNRMESNIIDLLFNLDEMNVNQTSLSKYIKESKVKYDFSKGIFIRRILSTEEKERNLHISKINSNNVSDNLTTISISPHVLQCIPKQLRFFPKEGIGAGLNFGKEKIIIQLGDDKKIRRDSVMSDKKTMEEINNAANYFDLSKKHNKKKNGVDVLRILNDVSFEEEEIKLGKKIKREDRSEIMNLGVEPQSSYGLGVK